MARHLCQEFPRWVSYTRLVALIPAVLLPLWGYLQSRCGQTREVAFIDSTPLPVCHNRRIARHRVLAAYARRGKGSMGYFYGFKLHLVVNDQGALLSCMLTPGNVDDRQPVPALTQDLWGKLIGDRGYLSQALLAQLWARGLQLITPIRKNMKNRLMVLQDKLLVHKRAIIETINDQLKNISHILHTRHRSVTGFVAHRLSGLIAYTWQPRKPAISLSDQDTALLPVLI